MGYKVLGKTAEIMQGYEPRTDFFLEQDEATALVGI